MISSQDFIESLPHLDFPIEVQKELVIHYLCRGREGGWGKGGQGYFRLARGGPNFFIKKFQGSGVPAAHPHPNIPKVPPPGDFIPKGNPGAPEIGESCLFMLVLL